MSKRKKEEDKRPWNPTPAQARAKAGRSRLTRITYSTDDLKRAMIRGAMQRQAAEPHRPLTTIYTEDYHVAPHTVQAWIRQLGMKEEVAQHRSRLSVEGVMPKKGREFTEGDKMHILRTVIDSYLCNPDLEIVECCERFGGVDWDSMKGWMARWPQFREQLEGAMFIRRQLNGKRHESCGTVPVFGAGYLETDFPRMLSLLAVYPRPVRVAQAGGKSGWGWPTRDQALQSVQLDVNAFARMVMEGGPFRDAWKEAVALRDATIREMREDIKERVRVRLDDALLAAVEPVAVVSEVTVETRDKRGVLVGTQVHTKTRREVDAKLIPYLQKVVGEAPTETIQMDHRHIIYSESAHADIEQVRGEVATTLEGLEERRARLRHALLEEVEEVGLEFATEEVVEEEDRDWI